MELNKQPRKERQQAKKILRIIKDPQHTIEQLQNAFPSESAVVGVMNCLVELLKEESEEGKVSNVEYCEYVKQTTLLLENCLKDNQIGDNERIKIIESLNNLSNQYSKVQETKVKEEGKTKRTIVAVLGALAIVIFKTIGSRES